MTPGHIKVCKVFIYKPFNHGREKRRKGGGEEGRKEGRAGGREGGGLHQEAHSPGEELG